MEFSSLSLREDILARVSEAGFTSCTEIQALTIPKSIEGANLVALAKTGTGKTAAFLLPTIHRLLNKKPENPATKASPRCIVLAPTRELVIQIEKEAKRFAPKGLFKTCALYGGTGYQTQKDELEALPDIIVGTTGRFIDFLDQKLFNLNCLETFILDEVDRMCDMGFMKDIDYIMRKVGDRQKNIQILAYSATYSDDVKRFTTRAMGKHDLIETGQDEVTPEKIDQVGYLCDPGTKTRVLIGLLMKHKPATAMIFVNTKDVANQLHRQMSTMGFPVHLLSGDVAQAKRTRVIEDMKNAKMPLLIATDVASRGLHIDGVELVVNYDIPFEAENYIHRIGRTGRSGAEGKAVTIICEDYAEFLDPINKLLPTKLNCIWPEDELVHFDVPTQEQVRVLFPIGVVQDPNEEIPRDGRDSKRTERGGRGSQQSRERSKSGASGGRDRNSKNKNTRSPRDRDASDKSRGHQNSNRNRNRNDQNTANRSGQSSAQQAKKVHQSTKTNVHQSAKTIVTSPAPTSVVSPVETGVVPSGKRLVKKLLSFLGGSDSK